MRYNVCACSTSALELFAVNFSACYCLLVRNYTFYKLHKIRVLSCIRRHCTCVVERAEYILWAKELSVLFICLDQFLITEKWLHWSLKAKVMTAPRHNFLGNAHQVVFVVWQINQNFKRMRTGQTDSTRVKLQQIDLLPSWLRQDEQLRLINHC